MLRKTIYAVATVAAIGGAALIPTEASAGGDGKGGGGMDGGMGGYHGHGHGHGWRLRWNRGDRTHLLAMDPRRRQGVHLLLKRHRLFQGSYRPWPCDARPGLTICEKRCATSAELC